MTDLDWGSFLSIDDFGGGKEEEKEGREQEEAIYYDILG